jgi:hypothetical protein
MNGPNGEARSLVVLPEFSDLQRAAGAIVAVPLVVLRPFLRLGGAVKDKVFFSNRKVSILTPLILPKYKMLVQARCIYHFVLIWLTVEKNRMIRGYSCRKS